MESPEECDGFAKQDDSRCLPPGDDNECRYGCARYLDPATENWVQPECPGEMNCGLDGVCRNGRGTFEPWGDFVPGPASNVQLGDLDGDGRDDLLTLGNASERWDSHPRVFFFDPQGHAEGALDPLTPLNSPTIARLITGVPEFAGQQIVGGTQFGLTTLFANPAHEIASIPYPYQTITQQEAYRLIRLKGVANRLSGEEILLHYLESGRVVTANEQQELARLEPSMMSVIDEIVTADIVESAEADQDSCQELVFTVKGDRFVYAASVCDTNSALRSREEELPHPIAAFPPEHHASTKPILALVDDDNHLDLVVGDQSGHAYIAFGRGDGTFTADKQSGSEGDGALWPVIALSPDLTISENVPFPLAIGDLVREGQHDWVLKFAVYVVEGLWSDPVAKCVKGFPRAISAPSTGEWDLALIADVNGDTREDLVAVSQKMSNLDVFLSTQTPLLDPLAIPTGGPVERLVSGDYNGDQLTDVAMIQKQADPSHRDPTSYSLSIAFSKRDDGPTESVEIAQFDSFVQLLSGNYQTNDMIEELGVLSQSQVDGSQHLTLFMGNRSERPIASFGLWRFTENESMTAIPMATGVVRGATPSVLTVAVDDCSDARCGVGLWHTRGTGSERLSAPEFLGSLPVEQPLDRPTNLYQVTARFAPRFVIGDTYWKDKKTDEDAFLFTFDLAKKSVVLWRIALPTAAAEVGDTAPTFSLIDATPGRLSSASPPKLVDLDGDGWNDLAVSLVDIESGATRALVLWGDAGSFSFSLATAIPTEADPIRDFAVIGSGKSRRLYAVTDAGVFRVSANAQRVLAPLAPVMLGNGPIPGGQALAMGDVTGDGLPDLAVAVPGGLRLYQQGEMRAP